MQYRHMPHLEQTQNSITLDRGFIFLKSSFSLLLGEGLLGVSQTEKTHRNFSE